MGLVVTMAPLAAPEAALLCRRKAHLTIRDGACKKKETQVTLADLGAVVTPVDAYTKMESDGRYYSKSDLDARLAIAQAAVADQLTALTGTNVEDRSLTLADLGTNGGSFGNDQTETLSGDLALPAGSCKAALTGNFGEGVEGNMVIGTLTNAFGQAVLPNTAAVIPSIVIKTTQGGAVPNVVVCNTGNSALTVPAGSVFHWRMIGAR